MLLLLPIFTKASKLNLYVPFLISFLIWSAATAACREALRLNPPTSMSESCSSAAFFVLETSRSLALNSRP